MLPGISTACFYPQYTEDALRTLAGHFPECVEVFINAACELEPEYLRSLRQIAEDAGIKIISLHPYTSGLEPMFFFSNYDRRYDEGLELYKKMSQAANLLGAGIIVFHGAARAAKISYEFYFERFQRLWETVKSNGVELCQENVQRCTSYSSRFFVEMARALPEVGYVLDTKQAVRAQEDIYDFAAVMGKRIRHIHISDHSDTRDCIPPGKGVLNIQKLLSLTGKNGFSGGVIVELYSESYASVVEIFNSYKLISAIVSTG